MATTTKKLSKKAVRATVAKAKGVIKSDSASDAEKNQAAVDLCDEMDAIFGDAGSESGDDEDDEF